MLDRIKEIKNDTTITDKVTAVREALAEHVNIGVVGGEGKIDDATANSLGLINMILGESNPDLANIINKVLAANTIKQGNNTVTIDGSTNLVIGNDSSNPVVVGLVGGDLAINPSVDINNAIEAQEISITRNGTVNNTINSGNVIGGVGGSAAISMGNINGNFLNESLNVTTGGKTTTTINGDVNTRVNNGANVGGFTNGGAAIAIGGEANSFVNGNTNLIIESAVDMNGKVDGVTAGVAGGGTAVTTIGGIANSIVEGSTTIDVTNGLVVGAAGGGVAVADDITGTAEFIMAPNLDFGKDAGYSDITDEQLEAWLDMQSGIPDGTIIINDVIQGGTATATTGDTNINLKGNTTAVGIIGGGMAVASHTYTFKGDNTPETPITGFEKDDAYGTSTAIANSGKATIYVNLDDTNLDKNKLFGAVAGMKGALGQLVAGNETNAINAAKAALADAAGQGAVAGVFGGGIALGHGDNRSDQDGDGLNGQVQPQLQIRKGQI